MSTSGGVSPARRSQDRERRMSDQDWDVVVIGAGISGICAAIKLREAGVSDVLVLEKAETYGGTWRANTYPGCACDVPSGLYSYSFAPKADWSRLYGTQPEILAYIRFVAERLDLRPDVDAAPRYVGRIGLRDADYNSLLIDWRAPAAAVFYQATAAEPQQVIRRRVLRSSGREVVGVEDELHVPHRLPMIPGAYNAIGAGYDAGAWAITISGAGSGLIALCDPSDSEEVAEAMRQVFCNGTYDPDCPGFAATPDFEGLTRLSV